MTTSTTRVTVVAVYSNLPTAQSAASQLESNGFPIGDIDLHSGERTSITDQPEPTGRHTSYAEDGLKGWFKSLFASEEGSDSQRDYEDAFKSGNTILALGTTEDNAERAADILNRYSPINVHTEAASASVETLAGTSVGTRGSLG